MDAHVYISRMGSEEEAVKGRTCHKLHISPMAGSMISIDKKPQKRNKTSQPGGPKGEETNELIFRIIHKEGRDTQNLTKNQFLPKKLSESIVP